MAITAIKENTLTVGNVFLKNYNKLDAFNPKQSFRYKEKILNKLKELGYSGIEYVSATKLAELVNDYSVKYYSKKSHEITEMLDQEYTICLNNL